LITGATSGIGRGIALQFAREGAAFSVVDLDGVGGGESVARTIAKSGGRSISVRCDVSLPADGRRAVKRTVDEMGSLDILANNAGVMRRATVL